MTERQPTPWSELIRWSLVGTLACVTLVLIDVDRYGGNNPLSWIQPGELGPSAAVFEEDFPGDPILESVGLDGQQFYAIARQPMHLDDVAEALDRPRYRLQRPLLSWLAWTLHPFGGGMGLVYAFFLVGIAAVAVGCFGTGLLTHRLGGSPKWAFLFGLLPGTYWSLRVTVADALAVGLALLAVALAIDGRRASGAVGALAVLARETSILVLVGWALHDRSRRALWLVVPALVVAGSWALWLRIALPPDPAGVGEVVLPFTGWWAAMTERWSEGQHLVGMASSVGAVAAAGLMLWLRGVRHPLAPAVLLQLAATLFMSGDVIGNNFGGTRSTMALLILAAVGLVTPQRELNLLPGPHGAAGIVGPGVGSGGASNR
jgi:hypothetical protein